jgi:hypothetical protein
MADTDINAVRKQKNAERIKQKVNLYLSSLMMTVPNHVHVLG